MKQRSTLQTSKIFVMILRNFASATLQLIQVYTKFQEDIHLPLSQSADNLTKHSTGSTQQSLIRTIWGC